MKASALCMAVLTLACELKPVTAPDTVLAASLESTSFSYRYSPGDAVQPARQEAHHAWAVERLGVRLPQKITYNKYLDRSQFSQATGRANSNGVADPERFAVHTLWSWDNHEPTHVYTAQFGRPPDFFNEGLAVALQTDPLANDFEPRFNGERLHEAAAAYKRAGRLPPLDQIVETNGFRGVTDATLAYRVAGSFVLFLLERDGIERVKNFFRVSGGLDGRAAIRARFAETFTTTLDTAERDWHALLETRSR